MEGDLVMSKREEFEAALDTCMSAEFSGKEMAEARAIVTALYDDAAKDAEKWRLVETMSSDREIGELLEQAAAIIAFKFQVNILAISEDATFTQLIDAAIRAEKDKA
jgi:hypothetical protein